MRRICLHGPESTGKSTVGPLIADRLGGRYVPEHGRAHAEAHGTHFTMADLVTIAREHNRIARVAMAEGPLPLVLDTDPLMTAVWAEMLFGRRDPWFDAWDDYADRYLLFDIDLPWVPDGTRLFGTPAERQRFFDLSRRELDRRGIGWDLVTGSGAARLAGALAALA